MSYDPIPAGADPVWQPQPHRYVFWTYGYRIQIPDRGNAGFFCEPVLVDLQPP